MVSLVVFLAACQPTVNTFLPPYSEYPCSEEDSPLGIAEDDRTHTGFSALDALAFIDSFELEAVYDLDQGEDTVASEIITLGMTRTPQPVEYVDRSATPYGVFGPMPDAQCLLGPMLRIPVVLRWSTRTTDGSVGWWEAEHIFEVGSVKDPFQITMFFDPDHTSFGDLDPVLIDYLLPYVDDGPLARVTLLAWGTLGASQPPQLGHRLALGVISFSGNETLVRYGGWTARPKD